MDGDPPRGLPLPRDRIPPAHDPAYRAGVPVRDEALRMRPQPDLARRYARPDLEPPHPLPRGPMGWSDHDPPPSSFGMRDAPPPRTSFSYSRPVDSAGARSGPYPPSDLPRTSRSTRPDEYYAEHHPASGMSSSQDGAMMASRLPLHRSARFGNETSHLDSRALDLPDARDPYRPPRRLSSDPKSRPDGYSEHSYYSSRLPIAHPGDPRSEPPLARAHSPGPISSSYPSAIQPRRVSNASPPYPSDPTDASLHRDKRPRLDLYSERAQSSSDVMLRPPSLRTSSSHRSIASTASDWAEHADLRDRRPRDPMDAPYRSDVGSKGMRNVDWAETERNILSRRSSAVSHHALESAHGQSSEAMPLNSQSSKVKRRKRAVLSCTECKQRKIKCDRNVPNCGSCVRRGVAHLCRWGDERDFLPAAPASNITPSNAALMARIAQLEAQIRVLQSSSSSPSLVHDAAVSERGLSQRAAVKYDASESSSGRSPRFSGPSRIPNPLDFTSRDRNTSDGKSRDDSATGRDEAFQEEEGEDESEQSDDSTESGAENAVDLLRALAHGTSLTKHSRSAPPRRDQIPASDGRHPGGSKAERLQGSGRGGTKDAATSGVRGTEARDDGPSPANDRRNSTLPEEEVFSTTMLNIFTASPCGIKAGTLKTGLLDALVLLPPRHKTEALIDHYLREAEPLVQSTHKPSLLRQLNQFWAALDRVRDATRSLSPEPLPDLQFAALLLAMCEAACEFMTPAEVLESEISKSRTSINDKLTLLARTSVGLLGMGQFVRRPNIWGMQTIIVLRHYCFNRDHREEYSVLSTMAIKAAEFMGLHRLGSALKDEERWQDEKRARTQAVGDGKDSTSSSTHRWKMLTSTQLHDGFETESEGEDLDPDRRERKDMNAMWLPRGSRRRNWDLAATKRYKEGSRVSREVGRKVWFAFATMDWLFASHFDRCYHCKDEMFTTQCPQNIDDSDLTDSDSTFPEGDGNDGNRPHRMANGFLDKISIVSMPTTNSFIPIHIEICHTVRSIADALNHGDESFETVLAIEARFREILRSLPRFFKLDGESEYDPEIHRLHRERPYLSLQRAVIHEYVHHRLLKLHRLYISRGYWNANRIHSTRTCVESARVVIGILRALDHVGCRGQRYWIFKFHIFHAVLALQVDLLYLARQPVNSEIIAKRADVVTGLKMLHARTDVEGRNPVLASSLKVIKVLREEEQARRAKNETRSEPSGGSEPVTASSPSEYAGPQKKSKGRAWTGASENTGDLAEHLERRVRETWYSADIDKLRTKAEAVATLGADAPSPISETPRKLAAISRTPSTEDDASLRTVADVDTRRSNLGPNISLDGDLASLKGTASSDFEGRDVELDDYLKLLSSYQNPDDVPDGSQFFDVLDDIVFENGSTNKLKFGEAVTKPLSRSLSPRLPLLRGATDLAAAGAGFDAFTSA